MAKWIFLFSQWFKRDVEGRYRGLWLGLLWPIAQPLAQLAVFTMIFHGFMKIDWPVNSPAHYAGEASSQWSHSIASPNQALWNYAANVLIGLAVFNYFSEIFGRAPGAILSQPSLVTKLKFPLILLPAVTVAASLIHIVIASALLVFAMLIAGQTNTSIFWLPLWVCPVLLYGASIALLLSSLGVYARDISQIVPSFTSLLMFLTPIFYPLSAVPESLRPFFAHNPIAWAAESLRGLLLNGQSLVLAEWLWHVSLSVVCFALALACFNKLRTGFADVL